MEKELEALESLISKTGCMNDTCFDLGNCLKDNKCRYDVDNSMCQDYEMAKTLKNALTELKAIKESNPNEALDSLKIIGNCWLFGETDVKKAYSEQFETIKNYILKSQENEKVLNTLKKHFIFKFNEDAELNGNIWGRLISIQAKDDEGQWDCTACTNIVDFKEDFDLLKRRLESDKTK